MSDNKKIAISWMSWLTALPFFCIALTGGGPKSNIYKFFHHLNNLSNLSELTSKQLFEGFVFPLSVWISILVLLAMNIGWLLKKRINPIIVYLGSFCGILLSLLALSFTLAFGLGLLLIPCIWFAFHLASWHLSQKSEA